MAVTASPFWDQGTATLTDGSATVTGQGTNWLAALLRPLDQIESADGRRATILSINSNTSITLDRPWQGGSQTAGTYKIWRTSDEVIYQANVQRLSAALGTGNIEALAEVTGAADRIPYFTGPAAIELTQLTAAARALLADTTVPRSGTSGTQHRNNTQNDARFMQPGAFGLGASGNAINSPSGATGIADLAASTFFTHASGSAPGDAPLGAAQGAGLKIGGGSAWQATIWTGLAGANVQNRWFGRVAGSSGGNSGWTEFATRETAHGVIDLMRLPVVS